VDFSVTVHVGEAIRLADDARSSHADPALDLLIAPRDGFQPTTAWLFLDHSGNIGK
jgi:hypothetical protein